MYCLPLFFWNLLPHLQSVCILIIFPIFFCRKNVLHPNNNQEKQPKTKPHHQGAMTRYRKCIVTYLQRFVFFLITLLVVLQCKSVFSYYTHEQKRKTTDIETLLNPTKMQDSKLAACTCLPLSRRQEKSFHSPALLTVCRLSVIGGGLGLAAISVTRLSRVTGGTLGQYLD